jgi:ABC-type transport system substrate-binding protein
MNRQPPAFHRRVELNPISWGPDYPSPAGIFDIFVACNGGFSWGQYCNPALDRQMQLAESIRDSNPTRSAALWAMIDREAVDRAIWLPIAAPRVIDIVSARIRNYEFSPVYLFLPDQVWLH